MFPPAPSPTSSHSAVPWHPTALPLSAWNTSVHRMCFLCSGCALLAVLTKKCASENRNDTCSAVTSNRGLYLMLPPPPSLTSSRFAASSHPTALPLSAWSTSARKTVQRVHIADSFAHKHHHERYSTLLQPPLCSWLCVGFVLVSGQG
jgi:hypothetical protein